MLVFDNASTLNPTSHMCIQAHWSRDRLKTEPTAEKEAGNDQNWNWVGDCGWKKSTGLWFFGAEGKQWVKSTIIFGKWSSICEPVIIAVFSRLIVSGIWKQVKSCLWGEKAQSLLLWLRAQAQEVHRLEELHKHTLIPCLHLALAWTHHSPPAHSHWVFVFWASASV